VDEPSGNALEKWGVRFAAAGILVALGFFVLVAAAVILLALFHPRI
jgi:hypothetical protein